jgi:hypothetical protein
MSKVIKATFSIESSSLETVRAIALATGQTIKSVIAQAISDLEAKHTPEDLAAYRTKYQVAKRQSMRRF